jgi:hypothetical protein
MKKLFIILFHFFLVIWATAGSAPAGNLWCETPDLFSLTEPSFFVEPSRLSNKTPNPDLWAETPSMDYDDNNTYETAEKSEVRNIPAHPDMYSETPDLWKISNFVEKSSKAQSISNNKVKEFPFHSGVRDK